MKHYFLKTTILLAMFGLISCTEEQKGAEKSAADVKESAASTIEKYKAYTQKFSEAAVITQNHATGHIGDFFFTHWKDGGSTSLSLNTDGAFKLKAEQSNELSLSFIGYETVRLKGQ